MSRTRTKGSRPLESFSSKGSFVRSNITFDTKEVEISENNYKVEVYDRLSGDARTLVENRGAVKGKLEDRREAPRVGDLEEKKQHLLERLQESSYTHQILADGKR